MKKLLLTPALALAMTLQATAASDVINIGGTNYTFTRNVDKQVSPGVQYLHLSCPSRGTNGTQIFVTIVDLTNPQVKVEYRTANNTIGGTTKNLADIAAANTTTNHKVVAGANANFWVTTETPMKTQLYYMPFGTAVSNGTIYTMNGNKARAAHIAGPSNTGIIAIGKDGKAYIKRYDWQFEVYHARINHTMDLTDVNRVAEAGTASIYTPAYGRTKQFKAVTLSSDSKSWTLKTTGCTEVLMDLDPGQTTTAGSEATYTIKEVRTNAGGGTLGNHDVAIVGQDSYASVLAQHYQVGDKIVLRMKLNNLGATTQAVPAIENATSGNIMPLENGVVRQDCIASGDTYNTNWYARTLYGTNAAGTKFVMAVCGNKSNTYTGLTTLQMADVMKYFGCTQASQVDCGGSAQMWIDGLGQVNQSTDAANVRPVHSGIFIVQVPASNPDPVDPVTPDPDDPIDPITPDDPTFDGNITALNQQWLYSTIAGNTAQAPWLVTSGQITRDIAVWGENLAVLNSSTTAAEVRLINALTGKDTGKTLSLTGITGGTFTLASLAVLDGKLYASNTAPASTGTLKIYRWDTPTSNPTLVLEYPNTSAKRLGDKLSVAGTNKNGRLSFCTPEGLLVFTLTDSKAQTTPQTITLPATYSGLNCESEVIYNPDGTFWITSKDKTPTLFTAQGALAQTIPTSQLSDTYGSAGKTFLLGQRKYFIATAYKHTSATTLSEGVIEVLDITDGPAAATRLFSLPQNGLGATRNTNFITSVASQITDKGRTINLWVNIPLQGIAMFQFKGQQADPDPVVPDPGDDTEFDHPIPALNHVWTHSTQQTSPWWAGSAQLTRSIAVLGDKLLALNASTSAAEVKVIDAKTGTQTNTQFNTIGVSGGTIPLAYIANLDGKIYGTNVATAGATMKIYRWDDITQPPTVALQYTNPLAKRLGDKISVYGNQTDGRLMFASQDQLLVFTITNGTINPEPQTITLAKTLGGLNSENHVIYNGDQTYWITSKDAMPTHVDSQGKIIETIPESVANKYGSAATIFKFGRRTYMMATSYANKTATTLAEGQLNLIDLTDGAQAATKVTSVPADGLSATRNTTFVTSAVHQLSDNGRTVNLWASIPMQGVTNYSYTYVPAGINDLDTDNDTITPVDTPVEYYNLQGQRRNPNNLTPGIYIRRQGTHTTKIIIK